MPSLRTFAVLVTTLLSAACSEDLTLPGSDPGNTPAPASLTAVAGDDQRAPVGAVLDQPLTVQALDASAQPVAGVRVEFAFVGTADGATLDPAADHHGCRWTRGHDGSAGPASRRADHRRGGDRPAAAVAQCAVHSHRDPHAGAWRWQRQGRR